MSKPLWFFSGTNCKLFHIITEDKRSLCGSWAFLGFIPDDEILVKGEEKWSKGQDCKTCFRKAGLLK